MIDAAAAGATAVVTVGAAGTAVAARATVAAAAVDVDVVADILQNLLRFMICTQQHTQFIMHISVRHYRKQPQRS